MEHTLERWLDLLARWDWDDQSYQELPDTLLAFSDWCEEVGEVRLAAGIRFAHSQSWEWLYFGTTETVGGVEDRFLVWFDHVGDAMFYLSPRTSPGRAFLVPDGSL